MYVKMLSRQAVRSFQLPRMVVVVSAIMVLAGCAQEQRAELPRLFQDQPAVPGTGDAYAVHPRSAYASFEREVTGSRPVLPDPTNKDYAMLAANRAAVEEALGQLEPARRDAMAAQGIMTGVVEGEQGKATAAAIAAERAKVFKGECYEIAMVNAWIGLLSLRLGDSETAAIGFRRALDADKMSSEKQRDDFGLAYWGLGMAALDQKSPDASQADAMFRRCGYKEAGVVQNENIVVLIELGAAPWKELGGLYGEMDSIQMAPYEPRSAEVFVDGRSLGKSTKLVDLYEQSRGVRRTAKDVAQGGKAVGKLFLSAVAGAFGGQNASNAIDSAYDITADTRTCYMFPNEVHVVTGQVQPGLHSLDVKFYDAKGTELARYEQVWHYVPAPAQGRQYVAVRAELDRCNVQGAIPFTKIHRVKSNKKENTTTLEFYAPDLPGLKVGDALHVCQFGRCTQTQTNGTAHWRCPPMAYNSKGQALGRPGDGLRVLDYDVGLVGEAKVVKIDGKVAVAEVVSLTTDYVPTASDMVTNAQQKGSLWF